MRLKTFLLFKVLLISTSNSVTSHPPEQAGNQYNFTESVAESPGSNHGDPGFNESFPTEVVNHLHGSALNTTREEQNGSREVDRDEAPGQQVPAFNHATVGESVSEGTTATSARPLDTSSEQPTSQESSGGELASSGAATPQPVSNYPNTAVTQSYPNETSSEQQSLPTVLRSNVPTSTEPKSSTHPTSTDQQSSPTTISTDQPSSPTAASTTAPQTSPTITSTTAPESSLNINSTRNSTTTEKGTQTPITQKCIGSAASPTTHALSNFGPGFAVGMLATLLLFATYYGVRWLYKRNRKRQLVPVPVLRSSLHELRSSVEYF